MLDTISSDLQEAYRYCEQLTKSHYENFPVGSLLIPAQKRPYIWSIYAFARTADDFADENYPSRTKFSSLQAWRETLVQEEQKRLEQLDFWEKQLRSCAGGKPSHPIFLALQKTIEDLHLDPQLLQDLLTAFKMDVTQRRYPSTKEVLHYCKHSANPVGRLVLQTFGYPSEKLAELSDGICTGLQLANFWQDIAVDLEKDRIYIPLELMQKHALSEEMLFQDSSSSSPQKLLEELGKWTQIFFEQGATLPLKVQGRLAWELKMTWLGGMKILQRACFNSKRKGFSRPKINKWDQFSILFRAIFAYTSSSIRKN